MTDQEIIAALRSGDYEIEHEEVCCCSFEWEIRGGRLVHRCIGEECWEGNILHVGNTLVAQAVRFHAPESLVTGLNVDDIGEEILGELTMTEMVERYESPNNRTHNERLRAGLVDFLLECGFVLEEDEERGFANEYTNILREPEKTEEVTTTRKAAEKWADRFLYTGDAATEALNDFRFVEKD